MSEAWYERPFSGPKRISPREAGGRGFRGSIQAPWSRGITYRKGGGICQPVVARANFTCEHTSYAKLT